MMQKSRASPKMNEKEEQEKKVLNRKLDQLKEEHRRAARKFSDSQNLYEDHHYEMRKAETQMEEDGEQMEQIQKKIDLVEELLSDLV